jgi:hypothetical protein
MDNVQRALELLGPSFARMSGREQLTLCGRLLLAMSPPEPSMGLGGGRPTVADPGDLDRLRRIIDTLTTQMMAPPDPQDDPRPKTRSALICPCCQAAIDVSLTCAS